MKKEVAFVRKAISFLFFLTSLVIVIPAVVLGGLFLAEKVSGKYSGLEGDMPLSGRIRIRVLTVDGEKTISGTFAVHCVTWG